ncbi:hypothetical protein BDA99DRAFT_521086 [Phascolomyces articulosus]|uniref:Uncharacterized protein n=1 Tax=Phascolomyces articulosus TaxID=60185 RepID=A0AAD5PA90_9FUNG|nr:hypothetical protein BDA99DRAFT_521086 [Phascolomyces articulosus]
MSSVSSHDGSEKDVFLHRMPDGFPHRYSSMRKTDLLDTFDAVRHRDTDTWSVAATIDDQESVISGPGGTASLISSSRATAEGRETDDDRSTLDGISETRDPMHTSLLADNTSTSASSFRLEALRDLDVPHDNASSITTDDDKRSRSNAAEFGDEGTRSATADFGDESDTNSDVDSNHHLHHHQRTHHHNVVNDDISAPPQPQPSFASVTKSFAELMEENEVLHNQLRNLQIAQKHQSEVIENLRSLTGCNEEIYGRALHLSQVTPEELERWTQQSKLINTSMAPTTTTTSRPVSSSYSHASSTAPAATTTAIPTTAPVATSAPIATAVPISPSGGTAAPTTGYEFSHHTTPNSRALTQQLARLAELVIRFVQLTVQEDDQSWRPTLEQFLFTQISDAYFIPLPFGTENQELLNLAYADQIRRFQTTLGANFAKWYRRQTVQSLSLNPATKEYLELLRSQMTQKLEQMLAEGGTVNKLVNGESNTATTEQEGRDNGIIEHRNLWNDVLDQCTALSLVLHGGEADVSIQPLAIGSKYDEHVMAVVGDVHADSDKVVKMVISPLFIDDEQVVLLPARVLLQ